MTKNAKNSFITATAGVTVVIALGHFLSFVKEAVIANYFGVSAAVDAYTIAIQIPVLLFSFVSVAIQSVVVPIYSDILINKTKEEADRYIHNLITLLLVLSGAFVIIGEVAAGGFVYLFSPGFTVETHDLCVELLRVSFPTLIFSVISQVLVAVLNVHKNFIWPSFAVYLMNFGIIGMVVWMHSSWGILSACIGHLIGDSMRCFFLIFLALKVYHYRIDFRLKNEAVGKTLKMSLPVLWSISIAEVNAMINRMVASFLFVGSISALTYANKINSVLMQLFVSAITTVVYPLYAESSAKNDMKQLNNRINLTLAAYALFIMPLMAGIFVFKTEIIEVAFARGAFDVEAVSLTQNILGWYTIGLLFMSFRSTITNVFYSLKDTKTPAVNATIGVVINIVLNLTLPFFMGISGLAFATSISAIFITTRLLMLLTKKHTELKLESLFSNFPGIIVAAIVMFATTYLFRHYVPISSPFVMLLAGAVLGVIVYFIMILVMKVPVFRLMVSMVIKKK